MQAVNVESVLDLLYRLIEDQEKVKIDFTVTPKKEETEKERAS